MGGTPFTLNGKGDPLPGPTAAAAELAVVRPFEVASAGVVYPLPKWSDLK